MTETVLKIGSPSLNRKSMIKSKIVMDASAMVKKTSCMDLSVVRRLGVMGLPLFQVVQVNLPIEKFIGEKNV